MRVLFLLSCLEPAGSETYCVALAKTWKNKHEIFWISDRLHFGQTYTSLPIHQKAFPGGIWNTYKVLRYVRDQRIELIHSHSRRAHWVAAQVAAFAGIPHITTIHQPPPVHLFSRAFPCLGDHTIAIDEAVVDHLKKHFSWGLRKVTLIRNGIDLSALPMTVATGDRRVLFLGRLTGGRWKAIEFFFSALKRFGSQLPKTCFQIVGRIPPERLEVLQRMIKEINAQIHPSFVETHDFVPSLIPLVAGSYATIGGGRSALESLAQAKPVIALGECGIVGLCDQTTWAEAMRTNFGDHFESRDEFYPAKLEISLRQLLTQDAAMAALGRWGREQVQAYYDLERIAAQVDQIYQESV